MLNSLGLLWFLVAQEDLSVQGLHHGPVRIKSHNGNASGIACQAHYYLTMMKCILSFLCALLILLLFDFLWGFYYCFKHTE